MAMNTYLQVYQVILVCTTKLKRLTVLKYFHRTFGSFDFADLFNASLAHEQTSRWIFITRIFTQTLAGRGIVKCFVNTNQTDIGALPSLLSLARFLINRYRRCCFSSDFPWEPLSHSGDHRNKVKLQDHETSIGPSPQDTFSVIC